ncbi:mucin-17-like [Eumetopias jubatus]|uniref:mucin-17-like n=1 Tax=Eumetopias jubatus TaxID=34886 RepID=UPI001015DB3D|nr:mucin-17-like [Eumetopias jubatus]
MTLTVLLTPGSRICLNGGTWNGKVCVCPSGYQGDHCENSVPICNNGGHWDGIKCVCTNLFQGPKCEEVVPSIEIEPPPETVSAQMEMTVTVTSMEYTKELEDRNSVQFQKFSEIFTKEMNIVYLGIPEYQGVNITRLFAGSIVVEHEVILKTNYTPEYKEVLNKVTQEVKEKIQNVTKEQISRNNTCESVLCYNTTATKVQTVTVTEYDPAKECRERAGDDYAAYFFVEYKEEKPNCINRCMPGFNRSLNCNFGKCQLDRSGPRCYCLTTDTDWYSGETCEFSTKKSLVYGLVGAAGAIMLLVLVVLLMFMFRSKKELKRQKSRVFQLYKWHEEDGGPTPGTFRNIGFDIDEAQDDAIHLDSIYNNFQPSLDHIDSETQIKIQRPQVMMTSI